MLVVIVAIWAFVGGFLEIFATFGSGETAGTRAMLVLAGLVSIAFGIVIGSRPDIGAVSLALVFGPFSLVYGVSQTVTGVQLHSSGKNLHSVMSDAA